MATNKGLTLIEVLIVVAVMGILLAMSALGLQGYMRQLRLNEAAVTVDKTLKRVQDIAVTQSRRIRLSTNTSGTELVWELQTAANGWATGGSQVLPNDATVAITGGPVTMTGRGLPLFQRQFVVTRETKTRNLTLLTSGLVIF
jgi:prepilin-type N-terminal cleavage/methylation domain-containing protein